MRTIWTELAGTDFRVTTVDAGGVPTRSLQAGAGEAVIFLHGTSGHLEAFARNIGAHAKRYACHAIDMLGHGYTGKPDFAYEIPRYRDHLLAYLDATGIESIRHAIYHQPDFVANIDNLLCLQNLDVRLRNVLRPEHLARITAPTLVVWGRNNPFGEVPEATAMHEAIPSSELVLFDDCGHWPQHEQAGRYNPLSLEFLGKHPVSP
jgi:pimeloyl-ACP methyl ester carboxylesterase